MYSLSAVVVGDALLVAHRSGKRYVLKIVKCLFHNMQGVNVLLVCVFVNMCFGDYLPMQKWAKIEPRMSWVVISPVISPR